MKTREEKTIEYSEFILEDLLKLYKSESEAYLQYKNLLSEYKKVVKRFNKTTLMNDSIGKSVIEDNEQLKENVHYTVQKARDKILYNIEEHRKTKEVLQKHSQTDKEIINNLKRELRDLRKYTSQLETELNKTDEIHHQFEQTTKPQIKSRDINSSEIKNMSFQSLLTKQVKIVETHGEDLTIAKLAIDEFSEKVLQLDMVNSDVDTIIKGLHKFFTVGLGAKSIVYYFMDNLFYFIFPKLNIEDAKKVISSINVPRKLSNVTFTFSIGMTQYKEQDTYSSLEERVNQAHLEALKDTQNNSLNIL